MRSIFWLLLVSSASIAAQPTLRARDDPSTDPNSWPAAVREYFEAVAKEVAQAQGAPNFPNAPPCDLTKAVSPIAPVPLPPPSDGLKLVHVAIGRGTQNYTCADSTAQTKPVSIGALATLYNATCAAANYPTSLALMPNASLSYIKPGDGDGDDKHLSPASYLLSGHHYFMDSTTPTFDMATKKDFYGLAVCAKSASSPAPSDAPKGENGFGSVPWLKLADKGTSNGFKEVYRLNTAAGAAPPTCDGMSAHFEVQYAAEYWFYSPA